MSFNGNGPGRRPRPSLEDINKRREAVREMVLRRMGRLNPANSQIAETGQASVQQAQPYAPRGLRAMRNAAIQARQSMQGNLPVIGQGAVYPRSRRFGRFPQGLETPPVPMVPNVSPVPPAAPGSE